METAQTPQYDNVIQALQFMHPQLGPGHVVELTVSGCAGFSSMWEGMAPYKGMTSGWYSNAQGLASMAVNLDMGWADKIGKAKYPSAVYVTMNPTNPALLGRANNRIIPGAGRTTDKDVAHYFNFYLDMDPARPQGTSSSNLEKAAAYQVAMAAREFTRNYLFWPEPMLADSGNGYHLVYKSWFENTPENVELLKNFLALMNSMLCETPQTMDGVPIQINIDRTVFNPARIIKLHGTTARKGDPTDERPHRVSHVMEIPDPATVQQQGVVSQTMLQSAVEYIAAQLGESAEVAPVQAPAGGDTPKNYTRKPGVEEMFTKVEGIEPIMQGGQLDVQQYLIDNGHKVREVKDGPGDGVKLYILERCVFDAGHAGGEAAIGQGHDGKIFYQCFHDSCKSDPNRRWAAARKSISGDARLGRWMSGGSFGVTFPHISDDGKPYARYGNFQALSHAYGVKLAYNLMSRTKEAALPGGLWAGTDQILSLTRAFLNDLCAKHGLPSAKLDEWLHMETMEHAYHPGKVWIESAGWDGVSRFDQLLDTVQVPEDQKPMWRVYLRKWLIQCIAALYHPNFSGKGVLTFTGAQNIGKTSWLRLLMPKDINGFGEGAHLDPAVKDSLLYTLSNWIVELGELDATFKKADVSRLKAFITNDVDRMRVPYGKDVENWKRQTVFAATVNDPQFLVDSTGNSRWWTVQALYINFRHEVNMQQLWAEVLTWYCAGEAWHL
ncbi:MAG: hypothetical protein GY809_22670, partial [Planctomycetes bacterium]|nr:hypothetical protein [Planctomycetota bacterium]